MKKIVLLLLSILNVAIISAQEQCLTIAPEPPQWIFNKSTRSLLTSTSYSMNIFVHIVRSSNGQGLGTGILSTIVNSLNSNFQDADIQFSLLGSEFIDNDYYYVNFSGKENQLFGVNAHCNAIDIYILGQSTSWNGAGLADDIPSTALIVHGNYYNTSTLPHEMGHCLGLYHTHHGTVNEGGGDINQCPELVDGSNSTICGDYISDTPADPNQWSSSSCSYTGTGTDANGAQYSPDVSNLMSYAYKPCRNLFSDMQISRMQNFIDNTTILQYVFHPTISSPSIVCTSGATFTANNLPPWDSIIWIPGPNLTVYSGQNTPSSVIKATGNGNSWVQVRLVNACGSVILPRKTVWAGSEMAMTFSPFDLDQQVYTWYPLCVGTPYEFRASLYHPSEDPSDYFWTVWDEERELMYMCPSGTGGYFSANHPGFYTVNLVFYNGCDWGSQKSVVFEFEECDGLLLQISPNPASSETNIELKLANNTREIDINEEWQLEVYTESQLLKEKKTNLKGSKYVLNTGGWKDGVYMVRVKYKDEILTEKLVVKK